MRRDDASEKKELQKAAKRAHRDPFRPFSRKPRHSQFVVLGVGVLGAASDAVAVADRAFGALALELVHEIDALFGRVARVRLAVVNVDAAELAAVIVAATRKEKVSYRRRGRKKTKKGQREPKRALGITRGRSAALHTHPHTLPFPGCIRVPGAFGARKVALVGAVLAGDVASLAVTVGFVEVKALLAGGASGAARREALAEASLVAPLALAVVVEDIVGNALVAERARPRHVAGARCGREAGALALALALARALSPLFVHGARRVAGGAREVGGAAQLALGDAQEITQAIVLALGIMEPLLNVVLDILEESLAANALAVAGVLKHFHKAQLAVRPRL